MPALIYFRKEACNTMDWNTPVTDVKGIGPKTADLLQKLNIQTVQDLLYHKPVYYKDLSVITPIGEICTEGYVVIKAVVCSAPRWIRRDRKFSLFTFTVTDSTGTLQINIFNLPFMFKNYQIGKEYIFLAKIKAFRGKMQMDNPEVLPGTTPLGLIAYYPLTSGISQNAMRTMIKNALQTVQIAESYSPEFLVAQDLCTNREEMFWMHQPSNAEELAKAKRSLAVKEILMFLQLLKETAKKPLAAESFDLREDIADTYLSKLPFQCTNAQRRAILDIFHDLNTPIAANRLIQGDVGSGKTAVALFAVFATISSGYQAVVLAPTGLLAEQHFRSAEKLFGQRAALLTGATSAKERKILYERLNSGEIGVLISTHAVLYDDVPFKDLRVMIIDEQHRFGVLQRSYIMERYPTIHKFTMSATPIPRSLAMVLHGSASVSVLDEVPPGRIKVKTHILNETKRKAMYDWIAERIQTNNEKVYVVCPLLEASEGLDALSVQEVLKEIKTAYPQISAAFLHGKMPAKEKTVVMEAFQSGKIHLLVSTTVVEVGVDIPDATIMVIESADRFGLAQLHQLRGRVGRGKEESYCYLVSDGSGIERLRILKECSDGFEIAKYDLAFRGAGDFFGTQQHGEMSFSFADILQDAPLFERLKIVLEEMPETYPEDYALLKGRIQARLDSDDKRYIAI